MKYRFSAGLLVGLILAWSGYEIHKGLWPAAEPVPRTLRKSEGEGAHWWLLPKKFSIDWFFHHPEARFVMEAPDRIVVRYPNREGKKKVFRSTFDDEGKPLSPEQTEIMVKILNSPNAYVGTAACGFEPGVLISLHRENAELDVEICFGCEELRWSIPGVPLDEARVGLSSIGMDSIREVLSQTFPEDSRFKVGN